MPVSVVYFANLFVNPSKGLLLVLAQLKDLVDTGLVGHATKTHIVISVPRRRCTPHLRSMILNVFGAHAHKVELHPNHDNRHEYPGISFAHTLACQSPLATHHILYFHSKGISRFCGQREPVELTLHAKVIARWRDALRILNEDSRVDKVGSSFSHAGWVWWNYWWARASHLARVEPPVLTARRHYYEDWLCRETNVPTHTERALTTDNYTFSPERCHGLDSTHPCDAATAVSVLLAC